MAERRKRPRQMTTEDNFADNVMPAIRVALSASLKTQGKNYASLTPVLTDTANQLSSAAARTSISTAIAAYQTINASYEASVASRKPSTKPLPVRALDAEFDSLVKILNDKNREDGWREKTESVLDSLMEFLGSLLPEWFKTAIHCLKELIDLSNGAAATA